MTITQVIRSMLAVGIAVQASGHPGAIEFQVENRHRLGTDVAPSALAGEIGYAGLTAVPFSLYDTVVSLRYETTPEQLLYVLAKLREILLGHPKVSPDQLHVRFAVLVPTPSTSNSSPISVSAVNNPLFLGLSGKEFLTMSRKATDRHLTTTVAGGSVEAFVAYPLPPRLTAPQLEWLGFLESVRALGN